MTPKEQAHLIQDYLFTIAGTWGDMCAQDADVEVMERILAGKPGDFEKRELERHHADHCVEPEPYVEVLWDEDDDCTACYDARSEHGPNGCRAVHGGMGPSDNTDVFEVECDCARTNAEVNPW